MTDCADIRNRLNLYLDNELQGDERVDFEKHLRECLACRSLAQAEQRFLDTVRANEPLYVASPELKERVRTALHFQSQTGVNASGRNTRAVWTIAAAVVLLLLLPILIWRARERQPAGGGPSSFALMAADTHLRHIRGQLPLEMVSTEPSAVSQWFVNKVSFRVAIPNYQEAPGLEKLYTMEGARLVAYKNDYAAYVAYQMNDRPISLVITSDNVAQTFGGEEIKAKGLVFHYNAIEGLKVLTWSDRGLTYALVSDLEERGQKSCVVCHQDIKQQDFIAPLKPR
ncbi:MAG TPA: zf-HC2 domain-containing protein [Pyrinomonadaceae bacterium]